MPTTPIKKINMTIYFENLTVRFHIFYILDIYVNFCLSKRCYLLFDL